MPDSIRVLCLGFGRSELRMMTLALESAAHTLPRNFRIIKADEPADVAVVNWSTLNIERTQAFLNQRLPDVPLISVSETGVLGAPGLCIAEDLLLQSLAGLVYEAIEGVEPASRAKPPEYVSWLSMRRSWVGEAGPLRLLDDTTTRLDDLPRPLETTAAIDTVTPAEEPPASVPPTIQTFEVRMDRLPSSVPAKPASAKLPPASASRNEQMGLGSLRPERGAIGVSPQTSSPQTSSLQTSRSGGANAGGSSGGGNKAPISAPPLPIHPLNHLRVLLVTPSPEAVHGEVAMLRTLGAETQLVSTEAEASTLFASAAVDLLLIDARWAEERGYRLCRTLAHHQSKSAVPIIMVAADLRPIERARAAYAGSQGLMRWPITEQQLIERVPPAVAWGQKSKPVPAR